VFYPAALCRPPLHPVFYPTTFPVSHEHLVYATAPRLAEAAAEQHRQ